MPMSVMSDASGSSEYKYGASQGSDWALLHDSLVFSFWITFNYLSHSSNKYYYMDDVYLRI